MSNNACFSCALSDARYCHRSSICMSVCHTGDPKWFTILMWFAPYDAPMSEDSA